VSLQGGRIGQRQQRAEVAGGVRAEHVRGDAIRGGRDREHAGAAVAAGDRQTLGELSACARQGLGAVGDSVNRDRRAELEPGALLLDARVGVPLRLVVVGDRLGNREDRHRLGWGAHQRRQGHRGEKDDECGDAAHGVLLWVRSVVSADTENLGFERPELGSLRYAGCVGYVTEAGGDHSPPASVSGSRQAQLSWIP
jgi:hypothetical protein